MTAMKKSGKGRVYDIWQKAGGKKSGNWTDLFGWEGGELMSAWSIATYIDNNGRGRKSSFEPADVCKRLDDGTTMVADSR